ncbi:MAG TPA: hypothetical protein VKV32_08510 [Stellaceae bacterium]|nr:hypothetical protein [Stellaceae bacterium]
MKKLALSAVLLATLGLYGCSWFTLSDKYGNTYGGFFDHGGQYGWQMATCEADPGLAEAAAPDRKRWMACCMWRHGVPIDNSTGCAAPPYFNG